MAGAGYKLFATGDVLSASDVNTYIMQQTVMVFASSAARTTALSTVLAEGMVSYLQDTNSLEVYDGTAWVGATGDITGLTAGTGVSISSASGPVPTVGIDTAVVPQLGAANTFTVGPQTLNTGAVGNKGLIIKMAASATANPFEIQNSTGTPLIYTTKFGDISGSSIAAGLSTPYSGNNAANAILYSYTLGPANRGLVVDGFAAQTADLTQWRNSAGSVLGKVASDGTLSTPTLALTSFIVDQSGARPYIDFTVANRMIAQARNAAYIPWTVRGAASQTANLFEAQDSSGTILARVTSAGAIVSASSVAAASFNTSSTGFQAGVYNGGGYIRIEKATASVTTGSTTAAQLFLLTGTNANTVKLVIRSNGAETTILDNIPTT